MIRINLLGVDRQKAKKGLAFDIGKQTTLACSLVLVVATAGIGWWYWSLSQTSARLDGEIAAAQQEAARLQSVLTEVTQFEQRRQLVQQRVALIEELRRGQSIPVQVLDHVSRSLPDMMWLTSLDQQGTQLTIAGQSTTLIALSDFVGNLGNNNLLNKPIEIVNSQVEQIRGGPELIQFTVRAQVNVPMPPAPPAPAGRGARGRAGRAGRAG
jgi:type IV pilus assembly protein PilN